MPSMFRARKHKQKAGEARQDGDAFRNDPELQQLDTDTAKLLRLVKSPIPTPSKQAPGGRSAGPPSVTRKRRVTIEVLDVADENDGGGGEGDTTQTTRESKEVEPNAAIAVGLEKSGGEESSRDPFDFAAEEARVRKAADTFYPDLSPTKRGLAGQRDMLDKELTRLAVLARREEAVLARRRAALTEGFSAANRLDISAVKIQAHCRGYLQRKTHNGLKRKRILYNGEGSGSPGRLETSSETTLSEPAADQWHEVRDVEKGETWYYNAQTGKSQWERPPHFSAPRSADAQSLPDLKDRRANHARATPENSTPSSGGDGDIDGARSVALGADGLLSLPPLSPSPSACSSARSIESGQQQLKSANSHYDGSSSLAMSKSRSSKIGSKSTSMLPALRPDYVALSQPSWECDSISSERSGISSDRYRDDDSVVSDALDRRHSLETDDAERHIDEGDDDWQDNDTLFRADGTRNSKLRDTIRQALQVSKFDSISSLLASNVVLRKKPTRGARGSGTRDVDESTSPARRRVNGNQSTGKRDVVLGKRDSPFMVAVLADADTESSPTRAKSSSKAKSRIGGAATSKNPLANPPRIRDLADPGFINDEERSPTSTKTNPNGSGTSEVPSQEQQVGGSNSPSRNDKIVCFNCWSSSSGTYCEMHSDPRMATRKVKAGASALMCANWELDQLRRKYRAEEIQEIFMKQNASLRYDRQSKTYMTVIECRHPIYRAVEQLLAAWNKTMRRKLHTRAWFRSFIEQLRAGQVPKADSSTPALMRLKNTLQNNRWCTKYSDSVREFHPKAPVTAKLYKSDQSSSPFMDVITVDPGHPQLRNWILKTDCTKPVELYRPREYELPPRRCVPMPTPSFLDEVPLPVPNVFIDCGHIASWFERLSARVSKAALDKALLQIAACSPPAGVTLARRTKIVRPVTVMFATFGRKPTRGNLAVGGLTAELLIHMLVTTYIPAQFGNFVVFDRRAIAPSLSKDHDAIFACLAVAQNAPEFVFRALEHALNVRRPPCVILATRVFPGETDYDALCTSRRFPVNRVEQTGEELAMGFRTFWLVDARPVHEEGIASVQVAPSGDILSLNATSLNPTMTTRADRYYPFCIPTTRENTPIEFIHLLWIGQSSRNQPQVFTSLGAQQPGDFMKNSDPDGALGLCTSVVYRSWAYFQSDNPYEEFVTEDGVAYWYDKRSGETFWVRPLLPAEKHRGKDGDVDGVVADGVGERATLGVGAEESRYSTQSVRKFITKSMEAPEEVERRRRLVAASAKKHDIVVELSPRSSQTGNNKSQETGLQRIQVPSLSFQSKQQQATSPVPANVGVRFPVSMTDNNSGDLAHSPTRKQHRGHSVGETTNPAIDGNTKLLIDSITQALGSALPSLGATTGASGSVEMLQFGIGLGMGLGMRVQQQQHQLQLPPNAAGQELSPTNRSCEDNGDDDNRDDVSTSRSDVSSVDSSLTARSTMSTATSVDISPSPDELELAGEAPSRRPPGFAEKTPGYNTHPPPGEGTTWVHKPVDSSGDSQTAVDGFGGALHQRVASLPKDFVASVSTTKTCKMQANYLPVVKNMNQPRSVGIVRPRAALEEWLTVGYSPWSAGRAVFGSEFIDNLMRRPELLQQANSTDSSATTGVPKVAQATSVTVEKRGNVSQAVRESQQLETVMSLCRHGKYDEVEVMINSPDWTLDIDAMDATGNTLLSVACQNNNKRIAKLCLRRGADINTQNLNGQSVLHYCHEYGFHDLMEYLMDKGAREDLLNSDGLTCYEGLSKEAVDAL